MQVDLGMNEATKAERQFGARWSMCMKGTNDYDYRVVQSKKCNLTTKIQR